MAGNKSNKVIYKNGVNVRELALDILLNKEKGEDKDHMLLKAVQDKYDYLPESDKGFLKRLVNGTYEYRLKIDYVIDEFSRTKVKAMKPLIRELMRLSVYQIMYMDRVPDSAACNEAVKLAGKRGFKGLTGFVNGVLRAIARGYKDIKWPDSSVDPIRAMSIEYSCPELIVRSLTDDYGGEITRACLESSLSEDRGVYVRIDEGLGEERVREIAELIPGAIPAHGKDTGEDTGDDPVRVSDITGDAIPYERMYYAVRTAEADKVTQMSEFREGLITIQDISSMTVCEMADIDSLKSEGELKILDMCASPGGKSMHMASVLKRHGIKGHIASLDISEYRKDTMDENIRRMGLTDVISTGVWDATVYNEGFTECFDLVIADLPCSGLGVMGRKPDIKYGLDAAGMEELVTLQRRILDNAVRYVRPGGRLIYSTCTMRRAENDDGSDYILKRGGFTERSRRQLFLSNEHDGFYISVLDRDR